MQQVVVCVMWLSQPAPMAPIRATSGLAVAEKTDPLCSTCATTWATSIVLQISRELEQAVQGCTGDETRNQATALTAELSECLRS
mmetsp:Transcript_50269/g.81471  ORF Transcript_50269/g.81471 Transcript_50269/m.81471 type:complete len:85 (+) Transcript_50269:9-263(+)